MAAGYASARPALHPLIIEKLRRRLTESPGLAVDIGCGAGLSTAPLTSFCSSVLGVEPAVQMLPWARRTAPRASFAAARAEVLPLAAGKADLMTAAGSLNYVADLPAAFAEIRRVLRPDGILAVYDFAAGRQFTDSDALADWFAEFHRRYPPPQSEAVPLNPALLERMDSGMGLTWAEPLQLELRMSRESYTNYLLTETNVARAVRRGSQPEEIRGWLTGTLQGVFGEAGNTVKFEGYLCTLRNIR